MARVETALRRESDEINQEMSATGAGTASLPADREARADEDTLLHRRLHLLHMHMILDEVEASGEHERLSSMQQEIEEELERDEEAIWQIVPLVCSFILHYGVWRTGAKLLPRLLEAKEQVNRKASPFASLKVEQYLAYMALQAGKLCLASQESQTALDLIEQMAGYALLKGHSSFFGSREVWSSSLR
jgi:LuxR family maltose regulon positive regulatory protein